MIIGRIVINKRNGEYILKKHSYYKEDRLSKRGTWNRILIDIFEYNFPYKLNTIGVADDDKNSEDTFNEWLELQLSKTPERLIFEKLLVSIEVLYEAEANLCSHLWRFNDSKSHKEEGHQYDCERITSLVYEHTSIIEKAMSYIVLLLQHLENIDIQMMLDTADFKDDPLPYYKSLEIIERVLSTIEILKKS